MKVDFFNAEKIIRLTAITNDSVQKADDILHSRVHVFPTLKPLMLANIKNVWDQELVGPVSTYYLYIYALYPVSYLLNAFEITSDLKYLKVAKELANSFVEWEKTCKERAISKKREKILYGDHATSNRTQAFCYLLACLKSVEEDIPNFIYSELLKNGNYLSDIENYSHYNHGLMMDLALLGLLNTFDANDLTYPVSYKNSLIDRLSHSISRDLTVDGVHVENSTGYHFWMLNFLGKIKEPLKALDDKLHKESVDAFNNAKLYAEYITRPNGTVPCIGDTHFGLNYRSKNDINSKLFKHADQVIFRSAENDVWAYLASGYKTHVHKHADNGSFILFYNGLDILIDPGFLNYEDSEDSKAIKSASFHNVARPKGQEQKIIKKEITGSNQNYLENLSSSRINAFEIYENYEVALATIGDYEDACAERLVIWFKPNVFLIIDTVQSNKQTIEQIFHLNPDLSYDHVDKCIDILDEKIIQYVNCLSTVSKVLMRW